MQSHPNGWLFLLTLSNEFTFLMIKKIFFVLALALISQLVVSCVDCNCLPKQTFKVSYKGIVLRNLDSPNELLQSSTATAIPATRYGILIEFATEKIAWRIPKATFGLISSAYACDCIGDDYFPIEEISALQIFSNNDFDPSHPKGTELSAHFKFKRDKAMFSVADYIKSLKEQNHNSNSVFFQGLFLQTAPTGTKKHKFKIIITLSDNRVLEAETTEVELT
ncbi:MAG: DUF5034 domain-containing protein [Pedobacter sp.]|nr:MAG: DUF5034 domain-containing protein [Pedobacter sp.]